MAHSLERTRSIGALASDVTYVLTRQELRHIRDNWENGFSGIVRWFDKGVEGVVERLDPPWLWPLP